MFKFALLVSLLALTQVRKFSWNLWSNKINVSFLQAAFLRKADVLKPKHLLGERTNLNTLPIEKFKAIVLENSEPLTTERYPGYKRGTKSFAGTVD